MHWWAWMGRRPHRQYEEGLQRGIANLRSLQSPGGAPLPTPRRKLWMPTMNDDSEPCYWLGVPLMVFMVLMAVYGLMTGGQT